MNITLDFNTLVALYLILSYVLVLIFFRVNKHKLEDAETNSYSPWPTPAAAMGLWLVSPITIVAIVPIVLLKNFYKVFRFLLGLS